MNGKNHPCHHHVDLVLVSQITINSSGIMVSRITTGLFLSVGNVLEVITRV